MIVGLTGGIGSGKSTVSHLFEKLQVPIINSDEIAHQFLTPDHAAFKSVIEHFGSDILELKGSLNRKKLGAIIFNAPKERLWLESLLHPLIKQEILKRCALIPKQSYCVVEIPLLIETHFENTVDRVLVVDCPEDMQIKRASLRDTSPLFNIKSILKSQTNRETRLAHADDVIDNSGTLEALKEQITTLHQLYMQLSK